MSFFRKVKKPADTARNGPRTAATVFGKHPGWDDHIDDIAIDTDLLGETKRWLYVEGIRTIVDHNAWDKLEPEQRLEEFDHVFYWRNGDEAVLGRLWSSRDGKGRTRYPMVICVHGRNLSQQWYFSTALPMLERMREQFVDTNSAAKVRAILDQGRADLAAAAEAEPPVTAASEVDATALAKLSGQQEFNQEGEHVGLQRVLYQIEREMTAFRPMSAQGRTADKTSGEMAIRAKHMRVPFCGNSVQDAVSIWMSVMSQQLTLQTPLLIIIPPRHEWCDLVVGPSTENNLRCLRTTPLATPLATAIPYTIEEAFAAQVRQAVNASRLANGGQLDSASDSSSALRPIAAQLTETKEPPRARETSIDNQSAGASRGGGSSPLLKMTFAAVFLLIAAAAVIAFLQWDQISERLASGTDDSHAVQEVRPVQTQRSEQSQATVALATDIVVVQDANWAALFRTSGSQQRDELLHLLRESGLPGADEIAALAMEDSLRQALVDPQSVTSDAEVNLLVVTHKKLRDSLKQWLSSLVADSTRAAGLSLASDALRAAAARVNEVLDSTDRIGDGGGAPLADPLKATVETAKQVAAIKSDWTVATESLAAIEADAGDDPLLARFSDWVHREVASAATLQDLQTRVADAKRIAVRVADSISDRWSSRVDRDFFRAESGLYPPTDSPGLGVFEQWVALVADDRFALLSDTEDPRSQELWLGKQRLVQERLEAHRRCGSLPSDLVNRLEASERTYNDVAAMKWDGTRQTRESIERAVTQQIDIAAGLADAIAISLQNCMGDCEHQLVEALQTNPAVDSTVLAALWQESRAGLINGNQDCNERLSQVHGLRQSFEALNDLMALPRIEDWNFNAVSAEAVLPVVKTVRDHAIRDAIDHLPPRDGRLESPQWQQHAQRYHAWVENAKVHLRTLDEIAADLAAMGDFQPVLARYQASAQTPIHAELVGGATALSERIAMLQQIHMHPIDSDADRLWLVRVAETAVLTEQRVAAWRRLGHGGLRSSHFLEHQLRARDALRTALETSGQQRQQVLDELAADLPRRWIEHANVIDNAELINLAMRVRAEFAVDHADERLSRRTYFNIMLHSFSRQLARAKDETEQVQFIRGFRTWLGANRDAVGSPYFGQLDQLDAMLAAMESAETSSEPDFSRIGPGIAGWSAEVLEEGEVLRFRPPASWNDNQSLVFRRVQPLDASPAFVSTMEVPVWLFIAAVDHAGQWRELWPLLEHAWTSDGRDHRRGPRVWRPLGDYNEPMAIATHWLRSESETSYAPSLRVEQPGPRLPMQQVSAAAGMHVAQLLGCRLPTYREWHAAYSLHGGDALIGRANLRRGAWLAQVNHFEQVGRFQAERPDEGGFDLGRELHNIWGDAGSSGSSGANIPDALWFWPVDVADGAGALAFRNLVGNVAEFVFNDPSSLDGAASGHSQGEFAQKLRAFTDQQQADLYVVGGSSLSRPDAPPSELLSIRSPSHLRVFSDVGFRLAFPAEDLADAVVDRVALVERFLRSVRYLTPASE